MKTILYAAMMLLLLRHPSQAAGASRSALATWGLDVVPSLFPYMVLCQSLSAQLSVNRLPPYLLALPLGLLGGSPSGSAALALCAGKVPLSKRQLLALSAVTGTVSPMFFLSTVSSWFDSPLAGKKLLLSHLLGALSACVLIFFLGKNWNSQKNIPLSARDSSSQEPIARSVTAMLNVGGCIIFYSVAAGCIRSLFPSLNENISAVIHALLEVSGGLHALSNTSLGEDLRLIISAATAGFSGLSILSQNLFFLKPLGVSMTQLLFFAFLRAAGSAFFMALLL